MTTGRILVVDDHAQAREALVQILRRGGDFEVEEASCAREALKRFEEQDIDVALVDIVMPEMGGVELAQIIQRRWPATSIVMITGYDSHEHAAASVSFATAYLVKPLQPQDLLDTVRDALWHRRQQYLSLRKHFQQTGGASPTPSPASSDPKADSEPTAENGGAPDTEVTKGIFTLSPLAHSLTIMPSAAGEVPKAGADAQTGAETRRVELTRTEMAIFASLLMRAPDAVDYVPLARMAKGQPPASTHAAKEFLRPHIFSLRMKIEPDTKHPRYILTVRGQGYRVKTSDGE